MASSLTLLAMTAEGVAPRCSTTGRYPPRMRGIQSYAPFDLIMDASDYWVARSSRAMTAGRAARHGLTFQTAKTVMASP
jgi:hypothetical protein